MTNVLFVVVASAAAAVTDCGRRRGQLRWSIAEHSRRNPYNTERDHLAEGFPVVATNLGSLATAHYPKECTSRWS
uniref:Putative secreted protein n=1 Tax=Anopheles marajoara TaxID=58244 RepID=A0A2M4CD50_9DIPT